MPLKVSSASESAISPARTEIRLAARSDEVGVLTIIVYGSGRSRTLLLYTQVPIQRSCLPAPRSPYLSVTLPLCNRRGSPHRRYGGLRVAHKLSITRR